ncbi:MAG: helix-turn-helix domain-containing protein [Pseudomonadota bacterium]
MPNWTKSPERPIRISILLFDRFSNLCLANCIEPLRAANSYAAQPIFEWSILTPDGRPSKSSSGLEMLGVSARSDLDQTDYLFTMASYGHEIHDTPATRRLLRDAARKTRVLIGLDAGPWLMASAGLLDNRRATVHWDLLNVFTEKFLKVTAERARVVHDGSITTCTGAMSALDLTLELIENHLGMAARLEVEALFFHDVKSLAEAHLFETGDPLVQRAMDIMRDTVEKPLQINRLAKMLSCQPRTLDRHFRERLGAPPGQVYRHFRLSAARKLIEDSYLSVSEISVRCGYDSPAALTRAIKRQYGASPRVLRQKERERV